MHLRSQSAKNPRLGLMSAQMSRKNLKEAIKKEDDVKLKNNWWKDPQKDDSLSDEESTNIFEGDSRIARPVTGKKTLQQRQVRSANTVVLRPGTAISSASSAFKLNVKTLKSITNANSMEVTPSEIIFENIEANQVYQTILYVQNFSKIPKRIRVFPPKTIKFWVEYDSSQALAAGMSAKLLINFESSVAEDLSDEVIIEYEESGQKHKMFVPLLARKPHAVIVCETFIDLGFVRSHRDIQRILIFQNKGITPGKVKILYDSIKNVVFEPNTFVIQPNSNQQVKMRFNQKESGIFRGSAEVQVEGIQRLERIDISATVVEYNKMVLDSNNSQTTLVDFGEMYFGQAKQIAGFLYNSSPKPQKYRIYMKLGIFNPNDDGLTLQTPADQGKEISEQIMAVIPNSGEIQPFSNVALRFECNSVASYEHQILAKKYALGTGDQKINSQEFFYSAVFKFLDDDPKEEPLAVTLSMKGCYPQIRLSKQLLIFGECSVHDHRETLLDVENKHARLPIEVVVDRTPSFAIDPYNFNLLPSQRSTLKISFTPQTVGVYSKDIILSVLNGIFKIPIKAQGSSQKIQEKKKRERGPECGVENFLTNDQYLENSINKDIFQKKAGVGKQTFQQSTQVKLPKGFLDEKDIDPLKLAAIQRDRENKIKYGGQHEENRQSRIMKEKKKILDMRYSQMYEQLKEKGLVDGEEEISVGPVDRVEDIVRGDPKIGAPLDLEFELGLVDREIEPKELDLPAQKDPLFVLKPIGHYEPVVEEIQKIFHCHQDDPIKKILPEKTSDSKEITSINKELSGNELRAVQAGPTLIDFGEVYMCSRVYKTFSVKNNLRESIKVQLKLNTPELKESFQKPQILKSGNTARFQIVLYSEGNDNQREKNVDEEFKARVQYIVNSKHTYEFEVKAKITQVSLKLSRQQIKFSFLENSMSMETTDQLTIENNGNGPGQFKWDISSKIFSISPIEGVCPPKGSVPITITYRPSPSTSTRDSGMRYEEDKLVLQVLNGMSQVVKCIGQVNEAKCVLKQQNLDFKQVLVCKEVSKQFTVKNSSRISALYQILTEFLPPNLLITTPISGKIPSDGQMEVGVNFLSENECRIESEIRILIRGGKILRLPVLAEAIIPKISIAELEFDFGKITALGNLGDREMTLRNESQIDAELALDLRGEADNSEAPPGIECLSVSAEKSVDENTFHEVHADLLEDNPDRITKHQTEGDDNQSDEEDGNNNQNGLHSHSSRLFQILLKPNQTLKLKLTFQPKNIQSYQFYLPITLMRYGKLPSLQRKVSCTGLRPKFIVDPQVLEFQRKIITSIEHQFPTNSEIILQNPEKRAMNWRIDASVLDKDKIFSIHPTQGRVDPGQTLRIKTSFNPSYSNSYQKLVPLFIDDPDLPPDQPCCFITLKGVAAYPRLLFDRREVLLPVVPLNIESRCIFWLINDGYDILSVRHKILEEMGQIEIKCNFPDGVELGSTYQRIKVEVVFSSKKPTSFTTRIEFKDNSSNSYPIIVSGTADNCLLVNFPFLQCNKGGYAFKTDTEKSPIQIVEEKDSDQEDDVSVDVAVKQNTQSSQKRNSMMSIMTISAPSSVGQMIIPKNMIESSREFIRSWLNYFVLSQQIQSFPDSIVESSGDQLFEFITFCSGKSIQQFKQEFPPGTKKSEKALLLFKQYDDIVRYLKAEGALLNHIRPQYLLSYSDYHTYIRSLPKEQNEHVAPQYLKMNPKLFQYLHFDSWISLFYSVIKIYQLAKINGKFIKTIPNCGQDRLTLPDFYINGSNVFSEKEGILIRWMEINFDIISGCPINDIPPKRIKNFEGDLRDGTVIANLLSNYVGGHGREILQQIRSGCTQDEDYYRNCEQLADAFKQLKIQNQFNIIDLSKPSAREVLMFILYLSTTIPYYIPKQAPILFSCVLGEDIVKTVEISNPTLKTICYCVKYEGSPDFTLDSEDKFKIEPKATFKYRIKFSSRVSLPQYGRITFANQKESTAIASTIVFDLKSQITGRVSLQIWNIDSPLYECKEFSVAIQNKFTNFEYGDFQVQVIHEYEIAKPEEKKKEEDPKDKKNKKKQEVKKKKKFNFNGDDDEEEPLELTEVPKINLPCFFCKTERVKLKRGATFNLQMAYIPLLYENSKCFVILSDAKVGEFQHEIRGKVDMPSLITELPNDKLLGTPISVDTPNTWNIPLSFRNPQLVEARKYLEQWLVEKPKLTRNIQKKSSQILDNQSVLQQQSQQQQLTVKQIYHLLTPDFLGFNVEIEQPKAAGINVPKIIKLTNPSYKPPPPLTEEEKKKKLKQEQMEKLNKNLAKSTLVDKQKEDPAGIMSQNVNSNTDKSKLKSNLELQQSQTSNSNQSDSNGMNSSFLNPSLEPQTNMIPITFFFKNPFKDYVGNLVIKNQQLTDVRRFRIVISAVPKPVRASLEMTSPARECVMQEIPIVNATDKDWQLKIQLSLTTPDKSPFFVNQPPKEGQLERPMSLRDFIVKKRTTGNIPLCFFPEWICHIEGKLTITNQLTQDQFDYDLVGIGEEPLAKNHIVIHSQSRTTTSKEILIENPLEKAVTYTVETDLIGASGQSAITIPAKKSAIYTLNIHPVMSGQYTGSVTFTKADGTYIWWTVLLSIDSPPSQKVVDLITSIRKPLAFDIDIANPTNGPIVFEVIFEGEGLLGDQYFEVQPNQIGKYELFYMPLKPGKFKGSVAFLSEKLGEIWYELNMQTDDTGVVRLPALKCELGKTEQHEITLDNPSNESVKVRVKISNEHNYEVLPEGIVIPPYESVQAIIRYRPSSLDKPQTSEVIFETDTVGRWVYSLFGQGLPPTNFETKIITAALNKDYSGLINFQNPFKDPVRIFIDSKDKKVLEAIKLGKRSKDGLTIIQALTIYQIPFSFQPKEIRCYDCDIVVSMNDKIQWRFPIKGMTESLSNGIIQSFRTKCRVQINQQFSLSLVGISDLFRTDDTYQFEIQNVPEEFQKIVKHSVKIKMTKNTLESPEDLLSFDVNFKPYKPFRCTVDFVVLRKTGGSWKFKILLESTPPNEDDVIILSAAIGESDTVSFKLTNRFKTFATFHSHFTEETDSEFSVSPQTGLLEPAGGKNGTQFIVTFSPLEYGKVRSGKLVIETQEMYWSYVLKGVLPRYIPPQIQESRFNYKPHLSYIEEHDKQALTKKNFITTNIKNQSVILPSSQSVRLSKNPSTYKGYFDYVPSLAGGEDVISAVSFVTNNRSNMNNNSQKMFRVQTAKNARSQKTIKDSQLAESKFIS